MEKVKINYFVDMLMVVSFVVTAITSIIMYFKFPSGEKTGRLFLWGLSRHTWADIHTYFGFAMIALVFLHFILHWNWVLYMTKSMFRKK